VGGGAARSELWRAWVEVGGKQQRRVGRVQAGKTVEDEQLAASSSRGAARGEEGEQANRRQSRRPDGCWCYQCCSDADSWGRHTEAGRGRRSAVRTPNRGRPCRHRCCYHRFILSAGPFDAPLIQHACRGRRPLSDARQRMPAHTNAREYANALPGSSSSLVLASSRLPWTRR
jgi:hypothetical protein